MFLEFQQQTEVELEGVGEDVECSVEGEELDFVGVGSVDKADSCHTDSAVFQIPRQVID